jgi:septal ring factor EnvC (AmiA/AmiB activator)
MTSDSHALARRVLVTVGALATVGAGAGVVHLAQVATATAAPADIAPAAMTSIQGQIDQQAARAASLPTSAASLGDQVRAFVEAVSAASTSTDVQTARATQVAKDIAAAQTRLTTLQAQLTAASGRLAALDAAGAQIAASRQSKPKVVATTRASGAAGGGGDN